MVLVFTLTYRKVLTGCVVFTGPIPYVITTEMFRQSSRPPAFMVAGSVHWLSNFTVGLVFPFLEVRVQTHHWEIKSIVYSILFKMEVLHDAI